MRTVAVTEISPEVIEEVLEREKMEPDILGKAVAGTETRGEGWRVALGEKCGSLRIHRGCSDKRQRNLIFAMLGF